MMSKQKKSFYTKSYPIFERNIRVKIQFIQCMLHIIFIECQHDAPTVCRIVGNSLITFRFHDRINFLRISDFI